MSSFTLRVLDRTDDGGVLRFVCVDDGDTTIYTSASTGATPTPSNTLTGIGSTVLEVLQLPLLAEGDDTPGVYVACGSAQASWGGCALFRSTDAGTTFAEIAQITKRATIGVIQDLPNNWGGSNTVDPGGVTVQLMGAGDLESITHALMLAGGNLALIGNEVVQFKAATLVGTLKYQLTGLLRGRLGTEKYIGTQAIGDRFILLDDAVTHVDSPLSLLGRDVIYRAVSLGNAVTSGADVSSTETQAALLPLNPIDLHCYSNGSAYVAVWKRRTRIPSQWANGSDAPLGEASERYRVRVSFGPTYDVDTEVTTTTATFGTGSNYSGYTLTVQQVSDRVGLGNTASILIG
jgi:hypothetical protein